MSEVNCANCEGACCQNVTLRLSSEQLERFIKAGFSLTKFSFNRYYDAPAISADISNVPHGPDLPVPTWGQVETEARAQLETKTEHWAVARLEYFAGGAQERGEGPIEGYFHINGRCPFLAEDNTCSIYNDGRPDECEKLVVGEEGCIYWREQVGIPTPVELIPRQ